MWYSINSCYSKCVLHITSILITQDLLDVYNLRPYPTPTKHEESAFSQNPQIICSLKFEKLCDNFYSAFLKSASTVLFL